MADHQPTTPVTETYAGVRLTQADFEALTAELDALRRRYRADLERRLRDARDFGSPADNDDVLTVVGETAIDESRIAQLEDLVRSAVVIADSPSQEGLAGLGCRVEVRADGRTRTYRLVGRRTADAEPHDVSLASPVGVALTGARVGDSVRVALPNGGTRVLEVVAVSPPAVAALPPAARAA